MADIFPFIYFMQPWSGKFNREREFMFWDNHQDITRHLFSGPSDLGTILPCPSGDCNKIDNCLCVASPYFPHYLIDFFGFSNIGCKMWCDQTVHEITIIDDVIFSNPVFICLEIITQENVSVSICLRIWLWRVNEILILALMWRSCSNSVSSEAYKWSYYPSYNIIQEAITKFLFQAPVTGWVSSLRWRIPMSHSGETVLTEVSQGE